MTGPWVAGWRASGALQVAANEDVVPLAELHRACETARGMLAGVR